MSEPMTCIGCGRTLRVGARSDVCSRCGGRTRVYGYGEERHDRKELPAASRQETELEDDYGEESGPDSVCDDGGVEKA